jgi:hypothetical protein
MRFSRRAPPTSRVPKEWNFIGSAPAVIDISQCRRINGRR